MDFIYFVRLIWKNRGKLILIPLIAAIIVFFLTQNEKRSYDVSTTIYTGLASGYSIESNGNERVYYFAINVAFDNMISTIKLRSTLEEVGLRLFALNHSLENPTKSYISAESYERLMTMTPDSIKALVVKGDSEATYQALLETQKSKRNNFVYTLLNMNDPHYSVKQISEITAKRIDNSDVLEIKYNADDPGIAFQTIQLLNRVFMRNFSSIKENQTDNVVKYFEKQLAIAKADLGDAEDNLLKFNKENRVINYYEQTKYIAAQKEELDVEIQREEMGILAAKAAITRLEKQIDNYNEINVSTESIASYRDKLADISSKISMIELQDSFSDTVKVDSNRLLKLKVESEQVKLDMGKEVDNLFKIQNGEAGIATRTVLDSWLTNVVLFEEQNARMGVLAKRKRIFAQTYNRFAPLGATLKRIEREIDVAERRYLSLLHSLALAKLKQQNIELSSNLKIIDTPLFPVKANPTKRILLVLVVWLAISVAVLVIVVLVDYLDTTLRTPRLALSAIGLPVAGSIPLYNSKYGDKINSDILDRALAVLAKDIKIKSECYIHEGKRDRSRPVIIHLFSTRYSDGKSYLQENLTRFFRENGNSVATVNYRDSKFQVASNSGSEVAIDASEYQNGVINSLPDIALFREEAMPNYIIVETPVDIYKGGYIVDIQKQADISYLVCRANREWSEADKKILAQVLPLFEGKVVQIVLNGVTMDVMENAIGEVHKSRSFLRRYGKKLLKFEFYKKSRLN